MPLLRSPPPQEEQGGAGVYNSDVRKLYDLKDPAWRYDIMPEIMNGKNVSGVCLCRTARYHEVVKQALHCAGDHEWQGREWRIVAE